MQRAVKSLQPFEFQSDFGPQPEILPPAAETNPGTDDHIVLAPEDLAMLLSQARAEGIAEGIARHDSRQTDRLQGVTHSLNQALANLVALAGHLEASSHDSQMAETSIRLINATARRIIDGQGDMFAGRKDISGNDPGSD